MPLQKVQRQTTSREFVEWIVYLKRQFHKREPIHYYLAQIALEVRRSIPTKRRRTWKLKQFLLSFKTKEPQKNRPLTEEEKRIRLEKSKMFWMALVQNPKKPPRKK